MNLFFLAIVDMFYIQLVTAMAYKNVFVSVYSFSVINISFNFTLSAVVTKLLILVWLHNQSS